MVELNENDPRVKRTCKLITQAFISVVSKKGFDSITVKDITTAAKINRSTFYAHFTDKYSLLDTLIADKFTEILSKKIQGEISLNEHNLRILILSLCDYFDMIKNTCKCGYMSVLPLINDKATEKLESIIYNSQKTNHELSENEMFHAELLSRMVSTSIYNAVYKWEIQKISITQEVLIEEILAFVFTGINSFQK